MPIVKEKAIHEQFWFIWLAFLAGAAVLLALSRIIYLRKVRALEEKHREEAERERLASVLNTAAKIQASMLPNVFPPFPERTEFDIYATMAPAKEVGGDFYDFFMAGEDRLGLMIADVTARAFPDRSADRSSLFFTYRHASLLKSTKNRSPEQKTLDNMR